MSDQAGGADSRGASGRGHDLARLGASPPRVRLHELARVARGRTRLRVLVCVFRAPRVSDSDCGQRSEIARPGRVRFRPRRGGPPRDVLTHFPKTDRASAGARRAARRARGAGRRLDFGHSSIDGRFHSEYRTMERVLRS